MQLITSIIPNHSINTSHRNNMQHITLAHQMLYNGAGGPWGLTTTSHTPMAHTVQSIQYNLYRPSNGRSKYIASKTVGSSRMGGGGGGGVEAYAPVYTIMCIEPIILYFIISAHSIHSKSDNVYMRQPVVLVACEM